MDKHHAQQLNHLESSQKLHHGHHALHQAHASLGDLVSTLVGHWEVILFGGLTVCLIYSLLGLIGRTTLQLASPGLRPSYGRAADTGNGQLILFLGSLICVALALLFVGQFHQPAVDALSTITGGQS